MRMLIFKDLLKKSTMMVTYLTLIKKNLSLNKSKRKQGAKIIQKEFHHFWKLKEQIWIKLKILKRIVYQLNNQDKEKRSILKHYKKQQNN